MEKERIAKILENLNQPKFRLKQIQKAIYQDGVFDWEKMTTIPKDLREKLKKEIKVLSFEVKNVITDKNKKSAKALLELLDGNCMETVLISPKPGNWSVCLSTQVGCPLGCEFCATGKMGFKRNLTSEEITDQVLFWKRYLISESLSSKRSSHLTLSLSSGRRGKSRKETFNIVFMGMGEPFLNWENVREAIQDLHNPEFFNFGWRSISVSTSGIPEGIEKMAQEFPQINLAISLHFANDQKRSCYMPINKKYNLAVLREALQKYFSQCRRKVFVEYVMLFGINDSQKDAQDLIKYLKSIGDTHLLHVNLIPYNKSVIARSETTRQSRSLTGSPPCSSGRRGYSRDDTEPSSREKIQEFKGYLLKNGIGATIRKSLGGEIQGACGQLAGKK